MESSNSMRGWPRKMWVRVRPVLIGTLCLWSLGTAPIMIQDASEKDEPQSASPDEETPSLEFLEFLGEFETEDGEWTDPEDMNEMEMEDPEQNKNEEK